MTSSSESNKSWRTWRPPWAAHVVGRYERRTWDEATGLPEPQQIEMLCEQCEAKWKTSCATGQVRRHIGAFAMVHLHRDPLEPVPPARRASDGDP